MQFVHICDAPWLREEIVRVPKMGSKNIACMNATAMCGDMAMLQQKQSEVKARQAKQSQAKASQGKPR